MRIKSKLSINDYNLLGSRTVKQSFYFLNRTEIWVGRWVKNEKGIQVVIKSLRHCAKSGIKSRNSLPNFYMNILCLASCADPPRGQVEGGIRNWFWVKDGMSEGREVEGLRIFREEGRGKREGEGRIWHKKSVEVVGRTQPKSALSLSVITPSMICLSTQSFDYCNYKKIIVVYWIWKRKGVWCSYLTNWQFFCLLRNNTFQHYFKAKTWLTCSNETGLILFY